MEGNSAGRDGLIYEARIRDLQSEVDRLKEAVNDQACPECGRHRPYCTCLEDCRADCIARARQMADLKAEVERLRESLIKIHDRSGDRAFVFFESAAALEGEQ